MMRSRRDHNGLGISAQETNLIKSEEKGDEKLSSSTFLLSMNLAPEAIQHFSHHHLLLLVLQQTTEEELCQRIDMSLDHRVLGVRTVDCHPEMS